jgi:hypothetical protein
MGTDGYRYDDESDRIVPKEAGSNLEAVDRLWDQSDEGFTDHAGLAEDDNDSYHGMVIEFGEFSLALESRSHILGDDTASLSTLAIPSPTNYQSDSDDDMETSDDGKPGDPSTVTTGSSLTDSTTKELSIKDYIANLLANTSFDPTIRQAILNTQKAVDKADGAS